MNDVGIIQAIDNCEDINLNQTWGANKLSEKREKESGQGGFGHLGRSVWFGLD